MTETQVELRKLPESWRWARIGDIAETVTGTTPSKKEKDNYGNYVPFVKPPELDGGVIEKAHDNLSKKGAELARILPVGSVLVSCIGNLGKTGISKIRVAFNQQINAVIFPTSLTPKFGLYYFQTLEAKEWLTKTASATTIPIVNKSKFDKTPFPVAPTNEQVRIVARLEELFTRLDAGAEGLRKVRAQLKRYRQAVLKYAFEGKLTREWRKTYRDQIEPAIRLLERIKQERKKDPKYKEPAPIDKSDLPEISENWIWTAIGSLFDVGSGGTPSRRKPEYWNGNTPWVSSGEVAFCEIKSTNEYITKEGLENSSAKLYPTGTVLMALYGEGKTRGQAAILRITATTNQAVTCIVCADSPVPPEYVYWWLYYRYYETRRVREGANQPNMYLHHVRKMAIPVAPLLEQKEIIQKIEESLSGADEIDRTVESSLLQAERLRQCVLKIAFEGGLVPQDPSDEPADKLLERIREERAKSKGEKDMNKKKNTSRQLELPNYAK